MPSSTYQTLTKNRAKSAADATWTNFVNDNSLEARCCHGSCFARIVKTEKNLLPAMPSFEPPSMSFILENTHNINKSLKFIHSTLMCLDKSNQKLNLFSTANLTSNQLLEIISNFEGFFQSLLIERMCITTCETNSCLTTSNDTSVSSQTSSGLGYGVGTSNTTTNYNNNNYIYQSIQVPTKHFIKYNEFNFSLMVFLFSIDRLQYTGMDTMFESFCGFNMETIPVVDMADQFVDHWHSMVDIFTSFSASINSNILIPIKQKEFSKLPEKNFNTRPPNNIKQSIITNSELWQQNYNSLRRASSLSDGVLEILANEFEILKERSVEEINIYNNLTYNLKNKASQMDLNECVSKQRQCYHDHGNYDETQLSKIESPSSIPLIFSFHNMINIECVCHGPKDYHKYTLNFHLEAGRPIDIVRYMAKVRLHYYNDSNCATQIDLFLVTYRLFVPLQELVSILLGDIYYYFPEQTNNEPHHLFYGNTILLIDVISNIFETGQVLGDYLTKLWQLMYCLILRGRYNLALALRRALQHYATVVNNSVSTLNYKVSHNVELHQQLFDPKTALKKLLHLSPSDIATQITVTDEEIFHSINLAEILYWFHLKYKKSLSCESLCSSGVISQHSCGHNIPDVNGNPSTVSDTCSLPSTVDNMSQNYSYRDACINMNRSTIRFHFLNKWTIKIINSTEKKSKKIKRLEFMFKLLDALFNLGNIHGAFAVYTGMSSSNNTKLITTIIGSNREFNEIWYKLSHMVDITNNYESYRHIVDSLQPPFIPYLGITMTDINTLKFSMKDNLKHANIHQTTIKSHSFIALNPKNITKISDEILFKGIKLPSPMFDESNLESMINVRKLWRYFNVLRYNITKPRLLHYNISIDKYIQSLILSCDQLIVNDIIHH